MDPNASSRMRRYEQAMSHFLNQVIMNVNEKQF
jgi:hypothetical protein